MGKNVFIVSSTMRKNGNSEILAEEFARGARNAGNKVDKVNIRDINLKFCVGCLSCQIKGKCALNDDMNELYSRVRDADVLVFATPVYFYEMSGQLKTFLDRLNPLFTQKSRFKEVYILATSADDNASAMEGVIKGIQGWVKCFDGVKIAGVVYGLNTEAAGDIYNTKAMNTAYLFGNTVE